MTKLQVLKPLKYGGKQLKTGDVFDCENRFVQALVVIGKAEIYVEPTPAPKRQYRRRNTNYQTREMRADT